MSGKDYSFAKGAAHVRRLVIIGFLALIVSSPLLQGQMPPVMPAIPVRPLQPPFVPEPPAIYPEYVQNNYVMVEPSPYSDAELRKAIWNQLAGDSLLHKAGIHLEIRDGIAILTGTADTWQDYVRAAADAYAAGARAVDNRLRVKFP